LSPGRIALGYAVIAILWIAFSDAVVTHFKLDPAVMTIKGAVFVFVTASLLYFTIRRLVQTVRLTSQERDETAKLYRTVVEASNEGICLLDESGRISFLNGRLAAMLGRPAEELQGKRLQDFIEEPHMLAQRGAQQSETHECRLRTDSDRKPWVLISRHPVLNDGGEVVQLVGTVIDITERKRAEEERRQSAERFRAIADYTYDWENWIGVDGKLLWVNPAVERITGYSVGECMVMLDFPIPIVAEADREAVARQIREAVQGSSRNDFEFRVRHKDGHLAWVAASWQPIYDSRGARLGHRSSIRDIAERKQAENALRRSETYLAEAQRLTHTGSWAFDLASGKYVYASEECFRIFELDPQERLPNREAVSRQIHPEDWDRVRGDFETSLREKVDISSEFRIALPDGTVKHLYVIRHPVLNDAGDVVTVVGTAIDMTDRKRAEQALRESEAYLAEAQRLSHTGSWALDVASGRYLYVSEEFCRIFGLDAQEGLPSREDFSRHIHPEDWDSANGSFEKQLREKVDITIEYRIVLPSGAVKHIQAIRHPLLNEAGDVVQLVGTVIDITERKRAEAALRESEERYRTLFEKANDAVFLENERDEIVEVNQRACALLGYSRDELLSMKVSDLQAPEVRGQVGSVVGDEIEKYGGAAFETVDLHRSGRRIAVEVTNTRIVHQGQKLVLSIVRDITDRKRAEEERQRHLWFLESLDRINRAMQGSSDLERMLSDVLGAVLSIFACDRAWLVYPCDPEAASWKVPMEHTRPEFPGAFAPGLDLPVAPEIAQVFQAVRASSGPVRFGPGSASPLPPETARRFSIQSMLGMAIYPKGDRPYMLGLHQCSGPRVWTPQEERLFQETGRRLADALTSVLIFRSLRESEERFRTLVQFSFDVYWESDAQHRFTRQEFAEGLADAPAPGSEIGKTRWEVPYLEPDEEAWRQHRATLDAHLPFRDFELARPAPDGGKRYVSVSGLPVFDETGHFLGYRGVGRHITDRKRAEQALRQSQAYLAEAQRLSHTGSWAFDVANNKYVYLSEECARIFELAAQEDSRTREAVARLIHPEDWPRVNEAFEKTIREKVDTSSEFRIALPSGTAKHVHAIRHPVLNEAGDVVQVVGTVIDITERKRAEDALRESETRFRTFVDHAADAFFMLDCEQGIIIDVNRCACESLGYTRQELVGMTPMAFHLDSDRAQMESVAERAVAGETVVDTHRHRHKDGSLFPVEVHTNLVSYGGRRFLLKVARDFSDRVRAEEQRDRLRELEADLAHINRVSMLGELTASIAHEVNQPLAGVVSNAGASLRWLAGDPPNLEKAREAVSRIGRDGKRAGEIIARIRALTRRAATPQERLDLNQTVQEVLALVGDEVKRNSVRIQTRFADDVFPVLGDRVQLQQVVLNLVLNGIEAMSSVGGRARDLVITTRNLEPDQVQVTVEDSGTGLDPSALDKIFDPFYTTKPGGMGMGLSISRSIIEAHGGRLWATAKDGPGTMFHFTLPTYHEDESHA